jgi:hypothetical protein
VFEFCGFLVIFGAIDSGVIVVLRAKVVNGFVL